MEEGERNNPGETVSAICEHVRASPGALPSTDRSGLSTLDKEGGHALLILSSDDEGEKGDGEE